MDKVPSHLQPLVRDDAALTDQFLGSLANNAAKYTQDKPKQRRHFDRLLAKIHKTVEYCSVAVKHKFLAVAGARSSSRAVKTALVTAVQNLVSATQISMTSEDGRSHTLTESVVYALCDEFQNVVKLGAVQPSATDTSLQSAVVQLLSAVAGEAALVLATKQAVLQAFAHVGDAHVINPDLRVTMLTWLLSNYKKDLAKPSVMVSLLEFAALEPVGPVFDTVLKAVLRFECPGGPDVLPEACFRALRVCCRSEVLTIRREHVLVAQVLLSHAPDMTRDHFRQLVREAVVACNLDLLELVMEALPEDDVALLTHVNKELQIALVALQTARDDRVVMSRSPGLLDVLSEAPSHTPTSSDTLEFTRLLKFARRRESMIAKLDSK